MRPRIINQATPYDPADFGFSSDEPSMTDLSKAEAADITNIVARHTKTGIIDHVNKYEPQYGEASSGDFHEAMNVITRANTMFAELPAAARDYFDNDPARFLDFTSGDLTDKADQLADLGLLNPRAEAARKMLLQTTQNAESQPEAPEAPPAAEAPSADQPPSA